MSVMVEDGVHKVAVELKTGFKLTLELHVRYVESLLKEITKTTAGLSLSSCPFQLMGVAGLFIEMLIIR